MKELTSDLSPFPFSIAEAVSRLEPFGTSRAYGVGSLMEDGGIPLPDAGAAAVAAAIDGQLSNTLAACLTPGGDTSLPLLPSVLEAQRQQIPLLAITYPDSAQHPSTTARLLRRVVNVSCASAPAALAEVLARAARHAVERQTAAHIHLDEGASGSTPPVEPALLSLPPQDQLEEAARWLNGSAQVPVVAGGGSFAARQGLVDIARRLAAPIVETPASAGLCSSYHSHFGGTLRWRRPRNALRALAEYDVLLLVGSGDLPTFHHPDAASTVQIDPERRTPPPAVRTLLNGPLGDTLEALNPLLEGRQRDEDSDRAFLDRVRSNGDDALPLEETPNLPIAVSTLLEHLERAAPEGTLFSCDPGSICPSALNYLSGGPPDERPPLILPRSPRHSQEPTVPDLARLCGGSGLAITDGDRLQKALETACHSPTPWLVEVPLRRKTTDAWATDPEDDA